MFKGTNTVNSDCPGKLMGATDLLITVFAKLQTILLFLFHEKRKQRVCTPFRPVEDFLSFPSLPSFGDKGISLMRPGWLQTLLCGKG